MKNDLTLVIIFVSLVGHLMTQNCSIKACKNQGIFDPVSCSCVCLTGYTGNDCSIEPDCRVLPNDPAECAVSSSFCSDDFLKSLCPKTCLCPEAISDCEQISCKNLGVFDTYQCKCICLNGFMGDDCSILKESLADDPLECDDTFCFDPDLKSFCPKTCY